MNKWFFFISLRVAKMKLVNNSDITLRCRLLSKPNWSYRDIQIYFNYGPNKAVEIKNLARKRNGGHPEFDSSLATISSVLALSGLTISEELEKLKGISEILGDDDGKE